MTKARIRKAFPERRGSSAFLLDVDFSADAGVTALFGPSGAGKSLTLEVIAGFVRPDEGRILLDDEIVYDAGTGVCLPPQKRRCGYVFQNYALFPHMTLRQNLEFAAARWPRLERRRKVGEALERFRLTDFAGRKPHEVSGGQKQRCSIARALLTSPRLLLLDEPARGLDAPLRVELYSILRQVRAEFNTPVLLVTHSLEECFELAEEMLVMSQGSIVQSGAPHEVMRAPATLDVARLLGTYNIFGAEIKALDPSRDTSVLRVHGCDLEGTYYPGHFKGDHVQVLVPVQDVRAVPLLGRPQTNEMRAELLRAIAMPDRVRLEFSNDLVAEASHSEWERHKHNKEWAIAFPPRSLRVI